jgi:hypothetical protein
MLFAIDRPLLLHHSYRLDRAHLTAYPAAFAVVHIYLDGYRSLDNSIRAIHPAKKTGWFLLFGWNALAVIYYGHQAAPFTCLPGFSNSW